MTASLDDSRESMTFAGLLQRLETQVDRHLAGDARPELHSDQSVVAVSKAIVWPVASESQGWVTQISPTPAPLIKHVVKRSPLRDWILRKVLWIAVLGIACCALPAFLWEFHLRPDRAATALSPTPTTQAVDALSPQAAALPAIASVAPRQSEREIVAPTVQNTSRQTEPPCSGATSALGLCQADRQPPASSSRRAVDAQPEFER